MEENSKVYRIRTKVGDDAPNVIHVPLNQTYDMFEILSLKIDQKNSYKTYESDYGVVVGRVIANGGVGVPNAKVSIFIEVSPNDTLEQRWLYNFTSSTSTDHRRIRYNLLPDDVDDMCHQNVGTFPNKRLVLDNDDIIETFDKYWKYTTTTNSSGDYMIFGVPVGSQTLHCDVDLSDCGFLSQRPRDMIYKGYNADMFESPNKFKQSTNLDSLVQIITQNKGIYVYPYWGDVSGGNDNFSITRCDISLTYEFEPTAVFMGSIITDKGSNAIGKNCTATQSNGKMSDLIAGEGTIEMIRKTIDNKVEEFPIKGNRLIDGDGVWCYQIPMNLDIVKTDEFGNLVPTDDPNKGIATRARVRFRISLDENPNDATARKRARYLVPNNPRIDDEEFSEEKEADYEFGSNTREESYCDLFWNKVYTVKNYIPRLQKDTKETNRKHTGIKMVNHYGDNNPMPYNSLTIKLSFTYRFVCVLTKIIIELISFVNEIISYIGAILCLLIKIIQLPGKIIGKLFSWIPFGIGKKIKKRFEKGWNKAVSPITKPIYAMIPKCIAISSDFCDDGINHVTFYPGCGHFLFNAFSFDNLPLGMNLDCTWEKTQDSHTDDQMKKCKEDKLTNEECKLTLTTASNNTGMLKNCVENELAQQNEATSFNFQNDWINGVLYAPLWYRKIRPKRRYLFGLIKRGARDEWCTAEKSFPGMRIIQHCAINRNNDSIRYNNYDNKPVHLRYVGNLNKKEDCGKDCHKKYSQFKGMKGLIRTQETMLGQTVYYYRAVEQDDSLPKNEYIDKANVKNDIKLLFATDIVLLGSLNECDIHGVPQFFKSLESTTYNMPTDILFTDYEFVLEVKEDGETGRKETTMTDVITTSESAGCDWGNPNEYNKNDGGLFYSIGCSTIKLYPKSCINLSRICEFGVSLDETKDIPDLEKIYQDKDKSEEELIGDNYYDKLVTDGFISWDELYNLDERSMFATMNGNRLKTKLNKIGYKEYDFRYLYPENFDGSLKQIMKERTEKYNSDITYKNNWKLETSSEDYYKFRMGNTPYFYVEGDKDEKYTFPRYENSFYFYFGLKPGKTAIEKFNSRYFADCNNPDSITTQIDIKSQGNSWCSFLCDGGNPNDDILDDRCEDGYITFNFVNIVTPYNLIINGISDKTFTMVINNIPDEKIIIINDDSKIPLKYSTYTHLKGTVEQYGIYNYSTNGNRIVPMLKNGSYQAVLTNEGGNFAETNFKIQTKFLTFKTNVQGFEEPNNVLLELFNNDLKRIASNTEGIPDDANLDKENVTRKIGGVITIFNIFNNSEQINFYKIEVKPKSGTKLSTEYDGFIILYKQGQLYYWDFNSETFELINASTHTFHDMIFSELGEKHYYAFGLPKADVEYTVTVTELCDDGTAFGVDSGNTVSVDIKVQGPIPYKMFVNDIDYEVIKNFDNNTGWTISNKVKNASASRGSIDMTNPWFKLNNIFSNRFTTNKEYEFSGQEVIDDTTYQSLSNEQKQLYISDSNNFYRLNISKIITEEEYDNLTDEQRSLFNKLDYTDELEYFSYEYSEPRVFTNCLTSINTEDYNELTEEQRELYNCTFELNGLTETINNSVYEGLTNEQRELYTAKFKLKIGTNGVIDANYYNSELNVEQKELFEPIIDNNITKYRLIFGIGGVINGIIDDAIYYQLTKNQQKLFKDYNTEHPEQHSLRINYDIVNQKVNITQETYNTLTNEQKALFKCISGEIIYHFEEDSDCINIDEDTYFELTNEQRRLFIEELTIYANTYDGKKYEIAEEDIINEFCSNSTNQNVIYNWIDKYIVEEYTDVDDLIEKANSVLELRKEMPQNMKSAFFMTCVENGKRIYVSGQTDKLPCTSLIVYHPEKAVEYEDYNELDGDKLKWEYTHNIDDIMIPTITYKGSTYFGDGSNDDTPCLTDKKPYSCGIMNDNGVSIPKKSNNKSFDVHTDSETDIKYIDTDETNTNDLFNFPIIDMIMDVDYIAWSAFVNMPQYGYDPVTNDPRKYAVTMNGLLSAIIYNGNINNNKFDIQTLHDFDLKLSDNLTDTTRTYVEKRIINGYDNEVVLGTILDAIRNTFLDDGELIEKINDLFGTSFNEEEINRVLSSIFIRNDKIGYVDANNQEIYFEGITITQLLKSFIGYTNYKVINDTSLGTLQYAFVLPIETSLMLQDSSGCQTIEEINGAFKVTLSEDSVNDCRSNGDKIIKFDTDSDTYFSIFHYNNNYPLNCAKRNENMYMWQIEDEIYGIFSNSDPQNMFSHQMKSDYFRDKNQGMIDDDFKSGVVKESENESDEEEIEITYGYGTTGEFEYKGRNTFDYPIFVVAETSNHVRTLSPVYDYSEVIGDAEYGSITRKINTEQGFVDNTQYAFGVAVENGHFYIDNYSYMLSCTCQVDSSTNITIEERRLTAPNQFVYTNISLETYRLIESKTSGMSAVFNEMQNRTIIKAVDYTGLKHLCNVSFNKNSVVWFAYIWNGNLPLEDGEEPGVGTYGIIVNDVYLSETETIYKQGNNDIIPPIVYSAPGRKEFGGWSINQPETDPNNWITSFEPYKNVSSSIVFYANWSGEAPTYTATFKDENNQVIETYNNLHYNDTIYPPEGHENDNWYVGTRKATFPYTIIGDVTFEIHEEEPDTYYTVTWESE